MSAWVRVWEPSSYMCIYVLCAWGVPTFAWLAYTYLCVVMPACVEKCVDVCGEECVCAYYVNVCMLVHTCENVCVDVGLCQCACAYDCDYVSVCIWFRCVCMCVRVRVRWKCRKKVNFKKSVENVQKNIHEEYWRIETGSLCLFLRIPNYVSSNRRPGFLTVRKYTWITIRRK